MQALKRARALIRTHTPLVSPEPRPLPPLPSRHSQNALSSICAEADAKSLREEFVATIEMIRAEFPGVVCLCLFVYVCVCVRVRVY